MKGALPYKIAFAAGVSAFATCLVGGVGYTVGHRRALPGLPPDALADYQRHLARGELRTAAGAHRLAARIDPTSYGHAAELVDAMRRAGDVEGEIEQYRLARERWPHDPATHRALGLTYCRHRRFEEGMPCLNEALRLRPADTRTLAALGDAWLAQGRSGDALRSYAEAVRLAPADAAARNSLGIALALAGDHQPAASEFAEALRLTPDPQYAANLERAKRDAAAVAAGDRP